MRECIVAYLEYEQQMHVANYYGGDMLLPRRRKLVRSATEMMAAAEEFCDSKPWTILSHDELKKRQ